MCPDDSAERLKAALRDHIAIERAKGVIAEHHGVDIEQAWAALRAAASDSQHGLADLARAIVEGTETI